jgi:hypothetical protein
MEKKRYRNFIFQKIYELAGGRVDKIVRLSELEKETTVERGELLAVSTYFVQKKLLKFEKGFVPIDSDARYLDVEPFIHLTAEGVDYYEGGFNGSPTHRDTYVNVIHGSNYGQFQQGGSHNRQDTSLTPEKSPTLPLM